MLDKLARLMRGHLKNLSEEKRKEELKKFLILLTHAETEVTRKKINTDGTPVECPYGIFKSNTDCCRFIIENNLEEFLAEYLADKLPKFKMPPYTENIAKKKDNSLTLHTVYWTVHHLCRNKDFPKWYRLDRKIKDT